VGVSSSVISMLVLASPKPAASTVKVDVDAPSISPLFMVSMMKLADVEPWGMETDGGKVSFVGDGLATIIKSGLVNAESIVTVARTGETSSPSETLLVESVRTKGPAAQVSGHSRIAAKTAQRVANVTRRVAISFISCIIVRTNQFGLGRGGVYLTLELFEVFQEFREY
jgi:hypothetical protein